MNTVESLINHFGGLDKVKDIIKSHAVDDMYCKDTGKWYTAGYWRDKMQGHHGIAMDQVFNAFRLADKIIYLGGVCDGKLSFFEYVGQLRQIEIPHSMPETPIYDYSKFSEYASDIAIPIERKTHIYHVETFRINNANRLFLISPELFNDQEKLLKLVEENWQYGYRL